MPGQQATYLIPIGYYLFFSAVEEFMVPTLLLPWKLKTLTACVISGLLL
jgi:hypothetical protein